MVTRKHPQDETLTLAYLAHVGVVVLARVDPLVRVGVDGDPDSERAPRCTKLGQERRRISEEGCIPAVPAPSAGTLAVA